ncbi:MAG: ABC transporter ATP-binding protein [bacterium]|nr:MAG: ABC transporter ATP-binding protein [bacterium]
MISIRGLKKSYGDFEAVRGLDLEIPAGQVFGFLGPNGAGKTTTIKIMAGLLTPTRGSVLVGGIDVTREPLRAKAVTGFIPDTPFLFDRLTGSEFLRFMGRLYGMPAARAAAKADQYLGFFDLTQWADHLIESYSHGMRKRLVMAGALMHGPQVVIVDEPMVGLDPRGAHKVRKLFRELAGKGITIFLTTHELSTAQAVCDRIGIIHHGKLIALGSVAELAEAARSPGSHLEEVFLKLTLESEGEERVLFRDL